jgi:anti-sigma factor RsiW
MTARQNAAHERCALARRTFMRNLDGETSAGEECALVRHLQSCPSCDRFTAEIEALTRMIRHSIVPLGALRRRFRADQDG